MRALRFVNRLLGLAGVALVPRYSVKMIIEQGNVVESFHPSRSARWLRRVAMVMPLDDTDKCSRTVEEFRKRGM